MSALDNSFVHSAEKPLAQTPVRVFFRLSCKSGPRKKSMPSAGMLVASVGVMIKLVPDGAAVVFLWLLVSTHQRNGACLLVLCDSLKMDQM